MKQLKIIFSVMLLGCLFILNGCSSGGGAGGAGSKNPNSVANAITAYSINGSEGTIDGQNIVVILPSGTDLTALTAKFTASGSVYVGDVLQQTGVTSNNFTNQVTYSVRSASSMTVIYTVTVTTATAKAITNFSLNSLNSTSGVVGTLGVITGQNISVTMPFGTDITALVASFSTSGVGVLVGGVAQKSGITPNNFTTPITYTVIAADGSTSTYIVTVMVALASDNAITSFSLGSSPGAPGTLGVISGQNITVTVPFGTDLTKLIATFGMSGTSILVGGVIQKNGVTPNDFTNPVVYTVTAADGTTQNYTVTVKAASSSEKAMTLFLLNGIPGVIIGHNISVNMPFGTDITALIATFTTTGVSVSIGDVVQTSGSTPANDFTNPVIYTVKSADGTTDTYTVTVTVSLNSSKALTAFALNGTPGVIIGQNITVTIPFGTDVTALIATYTTTGASVSVGSVAQTSGSNPANNFTSPVVYTVTAADGSTATYTVTVVLALNASKAITTFSLAGTPGVITGQNISVTVPYGTDITALIATFTTTGANVAIGGISQTSGTNPVNDFTSPVIYTVTAADGSTETYAVTVTVALDSSKAITAFSLAGTPGVIIGQNISVTVPSGTNVTSLIATYTTTGASVSVGGLAQTSSTTPANDFTTPVTYTVTAADGSSTDYIVTVTIAPSTAKAITAFSLNGIAGTINGFDISVSVSYGTNLNALIATFTTTGASVSVGGVVQTSGATSNSFSSPVTYTVTAADNSIATYTVTVSTVAQTGQLTLLSTPTIQAGATPGEITMSPNGNFAYVISGTEGVIYQYALNATTGQLNLLFPATIATESKPFTITISPNGKFAYVSNSPNTGGGISQYRVDTTSGLLTFTSHFDVVGATYGITVSPNNRFAYVANPTANTVLQYSIDQVTGELTPLSTPAIAAGGFPRRIAVSSNGNFAYVSNANGNSVSQYSIGTDGQLAPLSTPTIATGATPFGVTISPNGNFAYVNNSNGSSVSQYSIGVDGQLAPLSTPTVVTGANPRRIVINPNGNFLYVTNNVGGTIAQYSVSPVTGLIAPLSPYTVNITSPLSMVISPNGGFAYVTNNPGNTVTQYKID